MAEPRLEEIGDYNGLKGEKKRVVWAVVIAGLLIGTIYTIAYKVYDNTPDAIPVKNEIKVVPTGNSIPVE